MYEMEFSESQGIAAVSHTLFFFYVTFLVCLSDFSLTRSYLSFERCFQLKFRVTSEITTSPGIFLL